ncbi:glycoside hydrolase family 3 N-terminal domain-containing protein [Marinigracilibium pacificum]|uniref:beta-glucosidase n=1 Tax=Marinigracilibium pacificum TaxID=2729599 RepID=A0A848IVY1_9BACT|nr:glycoside hydrolase family 3 N-terminal domain-containing protein [Marinigracilibium pacificum]NMM48487.1 beta-glucosidase [Marinigracilibium pacificum]
MKNIGIVLPLFILFLSACNPQADPETIQASANNESDAFVESLLDKMSVEEKVGQMTQVTIDLILKDNSTTEIDPDKLRKAIVEKKVGSILNVKGHAYDYDTWRTILTSIQEVAKNETENSIPILYGIDAIHGATYLKGSSLFPHNIGMAASRNTDLVHEAAYITAFQTRSSGIPWDFDPVLGLGRQPLWSRFEETFGEDVHLVTEMGKAAITGYQKDGLKSNTAVAACMKHFLGYSVPVSGKDRTPANISDLYIKEYLLPPFQEAVDNGVATVMINSGEINGIPVHGSKYFLTEVLRNQMGFKGLAVSDWEDVKRLHTRHKTADSHKEAVRQAVEAGLDMSMVPYDYTFYDLLVELVNEGTISESRLDESVRRILKLKNDLGLFDQPISPAVSKEKLFNPDFDKAAYTASVESMVLTKNDGVLPLKQNTKIALVGPAANAYGPLHSSWSFTWMGNDESQYSEQTKTFHEGLVEVFGADNVFSRSVTEWDNEKNYEIGDVSNADVIILALGEPPYAEGPGVIDDLDLDEKQLQLAQKAIKSGKPVVAVLFTGRPRVISSIEPGLNGILLGFRPATFGGLAAANILAGNENPSGALPFTYPRKSGDVIHYDHKGTEEFREDIPNTYGNDGYRPQWDFGHGLSYTDFKFRDLVIKNKSIAKDGTVELTVKVENTGKMAGKKVVDVFVRDHFASITPSAKRLKAFDKVYLDAGESVELNFAIPVSDLAFIGRDGKSVIEPGDFDIMIGGLKETFTVK